MEYKKTRNRILKNFQALLELSNNRHSVETEIEGSNPKSNLIIDETEV